MERVGSGLGKLGLGQVHLRHVGKAGVATVQVGGYTVVMSFSEPDLNRRIFFFRL